MKKIQLQTLELTTLDKNNLEHVRFLKSLIKDETITRRFQGISASILHDYNDNFFGRGYFISDGSDLIGYII